MRLVIQRVNSASVSVSGKVVGKIDKGLFVLIGVKEGDTHDDADKLADKLSSMRIMADGGGKMNLNIQDLDSSILIVSQFTLHADTTGGNRPSFIKAAKPELAKDLYDYFISKLKAKDINVQTGEFGSYMSIQVELDGPVTITIES